MRFARPIVLSAVFAVVMTQTATSHAQYCPVGEGRLFLQTINAQNIEPAHRSHTCLGTSLSRGGMYWLVASVLDHQGVRTNYAVARPRGGLSALPDDSFICFGPGDDHVSVEDGNHYGDCADANLEPFDYGGHKLSIYTLEGNDHVHGGLGTDYIDGGNGDDDLWVGYGGDHDAAYGNRGNDQLWGGAGSNVRLDGGPDNDAIFSEGSLGATLIGGNGDDVIDAASCGAAVIDCGDGYWDKVEVPRAGRAPTPVSCETVEQVGDIC